MSQRHLIVSAVNFSEGGPLTVLIDSLDAAAATLGPEWRITALVHDRKLIRNLRVETIAFPQSKRSWFTRLRLEWWGFRTLSRRLKPDLWLSLHDMTPRVNARRQAVYCHNPSPFYRISPVEAWFDPRFFLFNLFYMRLYALFIRRNYAVIVQQSWLRSAFRQKTGHPNIVVARPAPPAAEGTTTINAELAGLRIPTSIRPLRLLYPALPRVFKNVEVLCKAMTLLSPEIAALVNLRLTFDGTENRWARRMARSYRATPGISLLGRQDRAQMASEYENCDAVLFPSRLETWGLPITEAKSFGKPLLVADLPYAHETVGDYANVAFVPVDDPQSWADAICRMATGAWSAQSHDSRDIEHPFMAGWPALWRYLVREL